MRLFTFISFVLLAMACFLQPGLADPLAVPEGKMPDLKNQNAPFRGVIKHDGYQGHTWAVYPHVENPSFGY
jgi:hypothetical protein